jgi:acyl-CoA thioesterase FadM
VVERTRLDAELNTLADDVVLEAQAVLVARDEETGRSRPLLEEERAAFERATA